MLDDRSFPRQGILRVFAQMSRNRVVSFIKERSDDPDQGGVAAHLGQALMEATVILQRRQAIGDACAHGIDTFLQIAVVAFLAMQTRQDHRLTFDQGARLHQFRRALAQGHARVFSVLGLGAHVHAGAHLDLDVAVYFQGNQRLAQRRPGNPQQLGQVTLGGKPGACFEIPLGDVVAQLIGDFLVRLSLGGVDR